MSTRRGQRDRGWNLAGAIYGQVLVTSLIAAFSEDQGLESEQILVGVSISMVIFWVAHIYAASVAKRLHQTRALTLDEIRGEIGNEWPMLHAALPAIFVLGLGSIDVISVRNAVELAIALGIVQLFIWGFVIARASGMGPVRTGGTMIATAGFGLLIVFLKVLVH